MTYETIFLGLLLATLYVEIFDIYPGGIIVPAYMALYLHQPGRIAATVVVAYLSLFSYKLLSRYVILFGRGEGMYGSTMIVLSLHPDYESFHKTITEIRDKWDTYISNMQHFIASSDAIKKGGDVTYAVIDLLSK